MVVIFVGSSVQETEGALESMLQTSQVPLDVTHMETRLGRDGTVTVTAEYAPWQGKVTA